MSSFPSHHHHSPQHTPGKCWDVTRVNSKTRGGQGRLWSSCAIAWGNYRVMQNNEPFFWFTLFPEESPAKSEARTRYWTEGRRDHSSHLLCQAQHVHSTFLSTTILLAGVTHTKSVSLPTRCLSKLSYYFSLLNFIFELKQWHWFS